ncbi:hypothetical protein P350_37505 [Burkholderia cepacia JBK9]|uniref:hypothetical protein n=1 Tax=Burkholderia arboris TaxID=488730 RepID=UPI0004DA5D2C|nr:hypothetical protein [Burkholderia arboris]ALX17280.1 hypothetical protein P350_37505 [Burkholderia cepacia JBK9]MCA8494940.1 hypothetical protein [Burkholderia arboris]
MNSSHVGIDDGPDANALRLNQDLVSQINEMVSGDHVLSDCWASGWPMLIEGVLWSLAGAIVWVAAIYLAS